MTPAARPGSRAGPPANQAAYAAMITAAIAGTTARGARAASSGPGLGGYPPASRASSAGNAKAIRIKAAPRSCHASSLLPAGPDDLTCSITRPSDDATALVHRPAGRRPRGTGYCAGRDTVGAWLAAVVVRGGGWATQPSWCSRTWTLPWPARDRRRDRGQRRRQVDAAVLPGGPAPAGRHGDRARHPAARRCRVLAGGCPGRRAADLVPGAEPAGAPGTRPADARAGPRAGACGRTSSSTWPGCRHGPTRTRSTNLRPAATAVAGRCAGAAQQAAAARRAGAALVIGAAAGPLIRRRRSARSRPPPPTPAGCC